MRPPLRHFVEICRDTLPIPTPIVEFGAFQVNALPEEDLRPLFPDGPYMGADMRMGPGVDVVLDLHGVGLRDESVGSVICIDTLEHVEHPRRAVHEMCRILRVDGIAVIASVFEFPIHDFPNDYWRFTPEGFRSLLSVFDDSFVGSYGVSDVSPQTVVGVGFKGRGVELTAFRRQYLEWSNWYSAVMRELHKKSATPGASS